MSMKVAKCIRRKLKLSQLTSAHVPFLSHFELLNFCYEATLSMLPDGALVFSYHHESRGFKPFSDRKQTISFAWHSVWQTYHVHRLPKMNHKGLCGSRLPGQQWRMMLGPLTGHVTLLAYDPDKDFAEARLWLMCFISGWVDPYFWQSDMDYRIPKELYSSRFSFVRENHTESVTPSIFKSPDVPQVVESVTHTKASASSDVTLTPDAPCPCGCGVTLIGRQKAATPACRKRLERQRRVAA